MTRFPVLIQLASDATVDKISHLYVVRDETIVKISYTNAVRDATVVKISYTNIVRDATDSCAAATGFKI